MKLCIEQFLTKTLEHLNTITLSQTNKSPEKGPVEMLAFGELESFPRFGTPVFFALHFPGIPG